MGVQIICRERLGNLIDGLAFCKRVSNRIEQRKVEQRIEARIDSIKTNTAALKERCMDHVAVFHFADDLEIRKLTFDRVRPIAPERVWNVLPRVHANAV